MKMIASVLLAAGLLGACATTVEQSTPVAPQELRNVSAQTATWNDRSATLIALTDQEQTFQLNGGGGNRPTYAIFDADFTNGIIEVDVASVINGRGGKNARGFAGVAFHLSEDAEEFEAIYLRMANGTLNDPAAPAPRNIRAVQYVAHPGFHFRTSRQTAPDVYEKPAPIRLGDWYRLKVEVNGERATAYVDGTLVLEVADLKRANKGGDIALWVGDGSDAYFANLSIQPE